MNLRLRLIVVFFLLSVVPVGAVTYYSYANNAQALREAAGFEAELLAGELSDRMRVVTAQLSQRVESLMMLSAADESLTAADAGAGAGNGPDPATDERRERREEALGAYAAILNNIEYRDFGRRGGGGRGGGRGRSVGPAPNGGRNGGPEPQLDRSNGPVNNIQGRRGGGPGPDPDDGNDAAPDRILIDLRQLRIDLFRELVPDREFSELTPEERQQVFAQIDQRMEGVTQGIELLRRELLASDAVEILTQGATGSAESALGGAGTPAESPAAAAAQGAGVSDPPPTAAAPTTPPVPPAAPTPPEAPAAGPTQRSAELTGSRLAVRLERDGEVVGEIDADVDLGLLLSTVFETTSRERGEVPFAVGADGRIYTPTQTDREQVEGLDTDAVRPGSAPGTTVLPDWIVATTSDPTGSSGLKFGIARPVGDALNELQETSARNAALGLAFIGLALIIIVPLSTGLTRNLGSLSAGVRRIAQGDYSARVDVRSNDEVGRLAAAFNSMAADVEAHQRSAVERERIRRELELGRQIQHDMLPHTPLLLGLTEIKGVSVPAREVGGDFFNYFQLQDGTVALLVGDVSGKGVGAALLMANIQAALRTRLSLGQDLASLAQELDVDIERSTPGPVYATLFVGIFDPVRRQLRCVNAGHNPQYVLRHDGRFDLMESTGRPIGLYAGGGYTEQRFDLEPGDVLFFYTDGCVEAENASGDMFGSERLERTLVLAANRGADDVLLAMESAVSRFRGDVELQDDATMMVVKVG